MGILVTPVQGDFVARLTGLDLSNPLDEVDFGQVTWGLFPSASHAPSPCPLPRWGRGKWGQTVMPLPPSKLMAVPVM
jgi:hypothetical protein